MYSTQSSSITPSTLFKALVTLLAAFKLFLATRFSTTFSNAIAALLRASADAEVASRLASSASFRASTAFSLASLAFDSAAAAAGSPADFLAFASETAWSACLVSESAVLSAFTATASALAALLAASFFSLMASFTSSALELEEGELPGLSAGGAPQAGETVSKSTPEMAVARTRFSFMFLLLGIGSPILF